MISKWLGTNLRDHSASDTETIDLADIELELYKDGIKNAKANAKTKTTLKFQGQLQMHSDAGDRFGRAGPTIRIGGQDIIAAIRNAHLAGYITVSWANKSFSAPFIIAAEGSRGYLTRSPAQPIELCLAEHKEANGAATNEHDLIEDLNDLDGQEITLFVSDEPVSC